MTRKQMYEMVREILEDRLGEENAAGEWPDDYWARRSYKDAVLEQLSDRLSL